MAGSGLPLDDLNMNGTVRPKKVAYFYDSDVGNYAYVSGHPMKPHRIRMAHSLIMNYGLYKKMEIYRAKPASKFEMTQFHTDEYVDFLQKVTPDNMDNFNKEQGKYNVGDDCPVFDGLFEFCGISAGGSMEGAARLNRGKCDIAVNWAGGLHHAKKSEASGFCYINDIVLGIIELLRFKQRVLYVDIDVHHGDGVEEAFYTTDRVMTCSFHKYGEYFPGTGELRDVGVGNGKYYAVNFPLRDGITDETYRSVFQPVIKAIMEWYQPEAVVLQCGGDSLSGDRLGCFNLSMKGHANCVKYVRSFSLPVLVVGGGGYTMRNVARTWAYETGQLVGQELGPELPYNDYYEYFAPDYELDVRPSNMDNANSPEYLEKIKNQVIHNLSRTQHKPSVQMQDVPRSPLIGMDEEEEGAADDFDEDMNPDIRTTQRQWDKRIEKDGELSESEDEGIKESMGIRQQPGQRRKRNIMDYQNPNAAPDDHDVVARRQNGGANDVEMSAVNGSASPAPAPLPLTAAARVNGSRRSSRNASRRNSVRATRSPSVRSAVPPATNQDQDGDVEMDTVEQPTSSAPAQPAATAPPTTRSRSRSRGFNVTPPDSPEITPAPPLVTSAGPTSVPTAASVEVSGAEAGTSSADANAAPGASADADVEMKDESEGKVEAASEKKESIHEREDEEAAEGEAAQKRRRSGSA